MQEMTLQELRELINETRDRISAENKARLWEMQGEILGSMAGEN